MNKVVRINTRSKEIIQEEVKVNYGRFGGRGLIAKMMTDEVDPQCPPLGEKNLLIIATGLFAGTSLPTAHRLSIGGKSPLTGGIKEANVGGTAAAQLAKHGIKMLVFEGLPEDEQWSVLRIGSDSSLELLAADQYFGLNNYELVERIHEEYGEKTSVVSIGAAGERQYKNASIQVTDNATGHPARAAARGGLGAVMGSKKIKAIIIEKAENPLKFEYENADGFKAARSQMIDTIRNNPMTGQGLAAVGTPMFADITASIGALPVRNFSGEKFERVDEIDSKAFLTKMAQNGGKTGVACQAGCIIRCSNIYNDTQGEFVTSGLEYETLALFGPNCDITDWDAIAEFDRLCDDLGVDTIEVGNSIALCMEAGKLPWGDVQGALGLVHEMMAGSDFGNLLGEGTETVGKNLGVKRIPTVKGQALAAYDPRALKGTGVTYATSTMGADHTCGVTVGKESQDKKEGQVELSRGLQVAMALADNTMCLFAFSGISSNLEILPKLMEAVHGGSWDINQVMNIGVETLMLERAFNKAAGFTSADDRLPEFFYQETAPLAGTVFDVEQVELAKTLDFSVPAHA